jgi:tight adherence protein B
MINPKALEVGAALFAGLSAAGILWAFRDSATRKFQSDCAWMRNIQLRFNPTPGDPVKSVLLLYSVFTIFLIVLVLITPNPLIAFALWGLSLLLPRLIANWAWRRRREQIEQQLPAAVLAMSNSLRAGLTLVQALQRLSTQAPEPIRTEFRVMANRYAYGADLETTIREARERLNLPNFNLFSSAVLLNRQMGGDISVTLNRISLSLDKLRQMRKTVEAHTSEGRTNIKVLLVAPILILLMMSVMDGEGVRLLFTTPQGYAIVLTAAAFATTGVYLARRITLQDV